MFLDLDIRVDPDFRQDRGLPHSDMIEYTLECIESLDEGSVLPRLRNLNVKLWHFCKLFSVTAI